MLEGGARGDRNRVDRVRLLVHRDDGPARRHVDLQVLDPDGDRWPDGLLKVLQLFELEVHHVAAERPEVSDTHRCRDGVDDVGA